MKIQIRRAFENNLKHISVDIPLYQLTGITGVSGSGKSTLLKNILAASGAINYTRIQTKTIRDALRVSDFVKAESISNMPLPLFIVAKNIVSNPTSTVSTLSGIQEILRTLFTEFGEIHCPDCGYHNALYCLHECRAPLLLQFRYHMGGGDPQASGRSLLLPRMCDRSQGPYAHLCNNGL